MPIEILKADLSPLTDAEVPDLNAGADSGVVQLALRNATGQDAFDLLLVLEVEDPARAGFFIGSGLAPQDELWGRIRITGQDNTAAPEQELIRTSWIPIGAYTPLLVGVIRDGGIRFVEIRMHPPSSADGVTYRWRLAIVEAEHSRALAARPGAAAGILTLLGDWGHGGIVSGLAVSVTGTPDDQVHVAGGVYLHLGRLRAHLTSSHTLNQSDGAAAALAAGQAYLATLSLGTAGVVVTKGVKAAAPVAAAAPEDSLILCTVRVGFHAGASVIAGTDLSGQPLLDRYFAEAGVGLHATVHAGQAVGGGSWRFHANRTTAPLVAAATNYLWQLASGDFAVTQTASRPDPTALGPWWEVDTDGTHVTALRDRRTYADRPAMLHLRGELPGAPGELVSLLVEEDAMSIERIAFRVSSNGGGSAGATKLDVKLNGTTLYTSSGTDDQRPSFAFNAATLTTDTGIHEVLDLRRGDVLSLVSVTHPTGGTPIWAEAYLVCRRAQ
jgi:hypothetical protein